MSLLTYKEFFLYGQRVRIPHRGQSPSSARQLPILAALHAGSPTLFASIIHDKEEKVNTHFAEIGIILPIASEGNQITVYRTDALARQRPKGSLVQRELARRSRD